MTVLRLVTHAMKGFCGKCEVLDRVYVSGNTVWCGTCHAYLGGTDTKMIATRDALVVQRLSPGGFPEMTTLCWLPK